MNSSRPLVRSIVTTPIVLAVCAVSLACSPGGDDRTGTASSDAPGSGEVAGIATSNPSTTADDVTAVTAGSTSDDAPADSSIVETSTVQTTPPFTVAEVAEVGVPGLDSEDEFCSAWSRFAGSFQVVAVTAAFGSGTPSQLAALEVAASPTVSEAYDELVASWPDELSSEADVVANEFLGPFARRLEVGLDALRSTGAGDDTIAAVSDAWLAGLARRDPTTPEFFIDLSDEIWSVIDEAADEFATQRVPFRSDPSLVTDVETPLTQEYLAVSCPDQGTLSGQEVTPP